MRNDAVTRRPLTPSSLREAPLAARWRWAVACAAVLLLAACGVGVGGTGTGEDLEPFGASAASVCVATIAPALACPATGTPAAERGTAPQLFVDSASGGRVIARLDGNRIELEARCAGQLFVGTWGVGPDSTPRYFGNATLASERTPILAVLQVTLVAGTGRELVMELVDARGQVLLALTRYNAVSALPSPLPPCP